MSGERAKSRQRGQRRIGQLARAREVEADEARLLGDQRHPAVVHESRVGELDRQQLAVLKARERVTVEPRASCELRQHALCELRRQIKLWVAVDVLADAPADTGGGRGWEMGATGDERGGSMVGRMATHCTHKPCRSRGARLPSALVMLSCR